MHQLATDPSLDPVLRRAFARVTCQIVRTYDDGSEGIINMMNRTRADAELIEHRKRIGKIFGGPNGGGGEEKTLVAVAIREVK